jgi:hypothetical protein
LGKGYSWFPILVGGLVGVGLAFLLNLFSIAIGLSLFTTSTEGAKMLATGGIIGMLIGVIATMYTSGFVAGYLSGQSCCPKNLGVIYGFASWCVSLILMVLLASAIGTYVAAYSEFVEHPRVVSTGAQVSATAQQAAKSTSNKVNPTVTASSTAQEKEVKAVGMQSLIIFILFFVGAFSSSLGGYIGYECWKKCKAATY